MSITSLHYWPQFTPSILAGLPFYLPLQLAKEAKRRRLHKPLLSALFPDKYLAIKKGNAFFIEIHKTATHSVTANRSLLSSFSVTFPSPASYGSLPTTAPRRPSSHAPPIWHPPSSPLAAHGAN